MSISLQDRSVISFYVSSRNLIVIRFDFWQNTVVCLLIRRLCCPLIVGLLQFLFFSNSSVFLYSVNRSSSVFPVVGNTCILRSVIQLSRFVFVHILFQNVHCYFRSFYPSRIIFVHHLLDSERCQITVCSSRVTKNHCEISRLVTFKRNWQVVFWFQRNVCFRIFCWISISITVSTENREICCVSWPFPVVCIATKFPKRGRRCTNQTDVFIILIYKIIELISVEEISYNNSVFSIFCIFSLDRFVFCINYSFSFCCRHIVVQFGIDSFGNVIHSYKKSYVKSFRIEFLIWFHCPESVFKIIFFWRRSRSYSIVTAVVIGENQSFIRNNLASTESTKTYDGIFQTGVVDRINFFWRQTQTFFLHIYTVQTFHKHQKPHSLICFYLSVTKNQGQC